ncbi:MAG: DUF4926 domain-containing protein [Chloroflexota bacterium]|nr:MAG: DUF4926 domain-containing protein [Chloroflexota bacterium]
MEPKFELLETVIVTDNFKPEHVLRGDVGTIVEIYTRPFLAYEVEFVNPNGETRALLTLAPKQIRRLSENDILTTRPLAVV